MTGEYPEESLLGQHRTRCLALMAEEISGTCISYLYSLPLISHLCRCQCCAQPRIDVVIAKSLP